MPKFNAAIAGCGRIASLFSNDPLRKGIVTHAAAYRNSPFTRLVAACDLDKQRLQEFGKAWGVKSLYANVGGMLKTGDIDILSICTPPATHLEVLKDALDYPLKAVFCEKPLADNVRDAGKMVKLCREKGVILQVGHQRRFDPLHTRLKKLVDSRKYGSVQQAAFYYTAGIKNTGTHMLDLLRFFFGDVQWVQAWESQNHSHNENDPNLDAVVKFHCGLLVSLRALDARKYLIFRFECYMEKAAFYLKNSGFELDYYIAGKSRYFSGYSELLEHNSPFETRYERNFLLNAVNHLAACIKSGSTPVSSGRDGLEAVKTIDALIRSSRCDGKRIYISKE